MPDPTYLVDASAITARTTGTDGLPAASFVGGMNLGAANAPGIGIGIGTLELVGEPQQFTLLDQDAAARTPQVGDVIGGAGFVDRSGGDWSSSGGTAGKGDEPVETGAVSASGDGTVTGVEPVWLQSLAAGWIADPTP